MKDLPKIITLCGSSRFVAEMAVLAWNMEKQGAIVLSLHLMPAGYPCAGDHLAEAEGVAAQMDELHLRKIDLSDEIFVVNKGGYIGQSTAREIEYAKRKGKPVNFLEPIWTDPDGTEHRDLASVSSVVPEQSVESAKSADQGFSALGQ